MGPILVLRGRRGRRARVRGRCHLAHAERAPSSSGRGTTATTDDDDDGDYDNFGRGRASGAHGGGHERGHGRGGHAGDHGMGGHAGASGVTPMGWDRGFPRAIPRCQCQPPGIIPEDPLGGPTRRRLRFPPNPKKDSPLPEPKVHPNPSPARPHTSLWQTLGVTPTWGLH